MRSGQGSRRSRKAGQRFTPWKSFSKVESTGSGAVIHTLRIPDDVARLIRTLHPTIKKKVRAALQAIVETPTCGKPLKEELTGLRSFRLGKLRILSRIAEDHVIEVVTLGPRRNIYEETYRKVRRGTD